MPRFALVLGLVRLADARKSHGNEKRKHAHTYLQFCANDATVSAHACVHRVPNKWPEPALLTEECREATPPHYPIGASEPTCLLPAGKDIYHPITIPMGLRSPPGDYRTGADTDTFTDWDRIRCRDGQLFVTGWYRRYTPQECARLCSRISDFYGRDCTHFSRQWVNTEIEEHNDHCGRDGDSGIRSDVAPFGEFSSAGVGTGRFHNGQYRFRGQCTFYHSENDECCASKAAWTEAGRNTSSTYCQDRYGERADNWDNKFRSWRLKNNTFTPTGAWPVTSRGRQLLSEMRLEELDPDVHLHVHKFIMPNGSTFWAVEEELLISGQFVGGIRGKTVPDEEGNDDEQFQRQSPSPMPEKALQEDQTAMSEASWSTRLHWWHEAIRRIGALIRPTVVQALGHP